MLRVNVTGGTNAGRRIIRQPRLDWVHICQPLIHAGGTGYRRLEAGFKRCPDCGCRRPS